MGVRAGVRPHAHPFFHLFIPWAELLTLINKRPIWSIYTFNAAMSRNKLQPQYG